MIFVMTEIVCIPTGTSLALKKKKTGKESQYIVRALNQVRIHHSGRTGNRGVTRFISKFGVFILVGLSCHTPHVARDNFKDEISGGFMDNDFI